ncbi:FG-GAP repeat domain-containing protein [Flavivirga rizhaonensis]|uniref:VCBS repeat-containing protein n=1 Tax=Flavivirga rizhaonensis TaxID=2559571 RepID=A0A4S1DWZ6_9FLAO|nr:VCBS repeat-containing protein [Flavivirga rizhaonensis]TGV02455.1 VCBS repeat-containing protein [Flavivirga rizhaonensis]
MYFKLSSQEVKLTYFICFTLLISCKDIPNRQSHKLPLGNIKSFARASDDKYISWKEHIIDDTALSGGVISGSDGLIMADLDLDGFEDIISVHESDTKYDDIPKGHIRIAFGSVNPDKWDLVTLAEGNEAGAAEDVAVGDINGDGYLDIVAACELAHLIYFENPKVNIRSAYWNRIIPKITQNRGSFIRVFTADLNKDKSIEVITANKGNQRGKSKGTDPKPISYFKISGNPLVDASWQEHKLINVQVPINSQTIDIDNDGDIDIIAGSRGENRIILMENISNDSIIFLSHDIKISNKKPHTISGFNMDFMDLNKDGLLDIILTENDTHLIWLEQPSDWENSWTSHHIGTTNPDQIVGFIGADINNDGYKDFLTGGYSRGTRDTDGNVKINQPLGRIAWFENPKDFTKSWIRHDISRRKRGMFDKFIAKDMDNDGDIDFVSTRGNSYPYDGVFWLEQIRSDKAIESFTKARPADSEEMPLPDK